MGARGLASFGALVCLLAALAQPSTPDPVNRPFPQNAEFHFLRLEYRDLPYLRRPWGRGWWMQDWPEADAHFAQGIRRLTRIDVGEGKHVPLTDNRVFDFPWIYATQAAYMDLSDLECARLRVYLDRGGFLVVDDFHGPREWESFREWISRVLPARTITDIDFERDPLMKIVYEIKEKNYIPGLRHLRRSAGGGIVVQPQEIPPAWRAIHSDDGRMLVAINFNMDIGDAWEHADLPEYPEAMTGLAYRFGINYIIYSMTH
jgi:hypothetical protein